MADHDTKYLARFYSGERLIDEWVGIGAPDNLLATHNRYYRAAADRVVVESRHNQAEESNG